MTHDHAPRPSPRRQEETEAPTLTAVNAVAEGGMSRCGIGLSQAEAAGGLAQLVTLMARQAARREFRRHRGRSLLGIAIILTLLTAALIGATLLYHHLIRAH